MQVDIIEEYEPTIVETEEPPQIIHIADGGGIRFNDRFTSERRLRKVIFQKIVAAKQHLPDHLDFVIYEAFRPRARQIELWEIVWKQVRKSYPDADDEEMALRCNTFVANPYKVGSGHQFGCSIDITLSDNRSQQELDMGSDLDEFSDKTKTLSRHITELQRENRSILCAALGKEGLVNYPAEWWHFSYGDRLWAILTNREETLYAPLDIA